MCGGFNVEVLENCTNEAGVDNIDDETRDDSVERVPYRDETTISDEEYPYRDDITVSDEEDPYRDETIVSNEGDAYREETTVSVEVDTFRDESTVSVERDPYRDETIVSGERDPYRAETTVSHERDTYRDDTTVFPGDTYRDETTAPHEEDTYRAETTTSHERDTYPDETTVSDASALNPKSESSDNETPKNKRLFSILDIGEYFSDSSETEGMSQYAPILFPRKETTNNVTSSESSSDSDELEDVYGHIVFRRNERHKPNAKVDLLNIDPKSLPYRISNRVTKQSKLLTEDNIDEDILHENLERLRVILLKKRASKLKKAKFSNHLVKEEREDYSYEIFYNGTAKDESGIPNVQLKPCSIVLERLNISSDVPISHNGYNKKISDKQREITKKQMAMLKPCSIVLERLDISTVVVTSSKRDSKKESRTKRKKPKKRITKPSKIAKRLRTRVFAAKQGRPCTRSSKNRNTRRRAVSII